LDPPEPEEGKAAGDRLGTGQREDLQLPVAQRLPELISILVDDHGSEVELAALELLDLGVDVLGRDLQLQRPERSEELAHQKLGSAPHRADPEAEAAKVPRRGDAIGFPSEDDEGFRPRQTPDELEPMILRQINPLLHQGEVGGAALPRLDQPPDVLHRARGDDVRNAALPARRGSLQALHHRVVIAPGATGEHAGPEVAEAGLGIGQREEQTENGEGAEEDPELRARRKPARLRSDPEPPSLRVARFRRGHAGTIAALSDALGTGGAPRENERVAAAR